MINHRKYERRHMTFPLVKTSKQMKRELIVDDSPYADNGEYKHHGKKIEKRKPTAHMKKATSPMMTYLFGFLIAIARSKIHDPDQRMLVQDRVCTWKLNNAHRNVCM
jgi:hypothetical protein